MSTPWVEAHAFAALFLCGLAWFVQLVHYPLMASVGEQQWSEYHRAHVARTTWVVMPAMLLEALCALALVWTAPGAGTWCGLGLLGVVWLSTAFLQVPLHARLERGFEARLHARLLASSWIRTGAWSARAALAIAWLGAGAPS